MLVYDAHATDDNKGPNGVVNYFFIDNNSVVSSTREFRINRITGVIRAEIEFDRETTDRYFVRFSHGFLIVFENISRVSSC